jgi:hypothetical protein
MLSLQPSSTTMARGRRSSTPMRPLMRTSGGGSRRCSGGSFGVPGPRWHRGKTTLLDPLAAAVPIGERVVTRATFELARQRTRAELETWQRWTVNADRPSLTDGRSPRKLADELTEHGGRARRQVSRERPTTTGVIPCSTSPASGSKPDREAMGDLPLMLPQPADVVVGPPRLPGGAPMRRGPSGVPTLARWLRP